MPISEEEGQRGRKRMAWWRPRCSQRSKGEGEESWKEEGKREEKSDENTSYFPAHYVKCIFFKVARPAGGEFRG